MNYTCATAMSDSDFCYLKMACVLKLQERWKEGKKERKKERKSQTSSSIYLSTPT